MILEMALTLVDRSMSIDRESRSYEEGLTGVERIGWPRRVDGPCLFTYRRGRDQTMKQEERGTAARGGEIELITSILLVSRSAPSSPALMGTSTARTRLEARRAWKVLLINMKRNLTCARGFAGPEEPVP